jgi:hypothetical protein
LLYWARIGEGMQTIRIKLSAASLDKILTDIVVHIRKAVQIPHLQGNCAPRREKFSLLLKQSFQTRQHMPEQITEFPVKEVIGRGLA